MACGVMPAPQNGNSPPAISSLKAYHRGWIAKEGRANEMVQLRPLDTADRRVVLG